MAELVTICDLAGRVRGSGFVADDRGTVITGHEAVDGSDRLVLHGPGGRSWLAGAADMTALPGLALALVRTDGLGARPLPVARREVVEPGTYVRLPARGWRQARVLAAGAEVVHRSGERCHGLPAAVELAIGTDGRDALRGDGEACGAPVLDATTGAVLAVVGPGGTFAVPLRAAAGADGGGPLHAVLERNAATVPGYGEELNLAGALELTGTTLGPVLGAGPVPGGPDPVARPRIAAELEAFTAGDRPVLGVVGDPGTGRTTAIAALAAARARGERPAPTLWLRGAELRDGDGSLADAVSRALAAAGRIVAAGAGSGAGAWAGAPAGAFAGAGSARAGMPGPGPVAWGGGGWGAAAEWGTGPADGAAAGARARSAGGLAPAGAPGWGPVAGSAGGGGAGLADGAAAGARARSVGGSGWAGAVDVGEAADPDGGGGFRAAGGVGEAVAVLSAGAGRGLVVVLDAPEEMPPGLAQGLGPWTGATARWLGRVGARLVVAARPEFWERAGALYPPDALYRPARPVPGLPPALPVGDLTPAEAATLRARLGIPDDAVRDADARHPLTLRLLADVRAARVTGGRPGRDEVFAAHLDLLALRVAVRIAASATDTQGAGVHAPGVRRLAARVAGRVHEAARRCLGPGQGRLDRAAFEALFPWRTGWASAVLTEGLLVPAGPGYRFAHEELSDWLQAGHLDLPTALDSLVHRGPATSGPPVPRHRIGPVLEALRRLPPDQARKVLTGLVEALDAFGASHDEAPAPDRAPAPAEAPAGGESAPDGDPAPEGDRAWWAARLLRETLLRVPDATPHLPVLHALAEHLSGRGRGARDPGDPGGPGGFDGRFWNRLRLPEPDRLDLLRRLLPCDHRYLEAAARRLVRDPRYVQRLLCAWFADERRLRGRPGATVATAAQALLHTHRGLAVDDLTEALVTAAHPRADELLAVLAEDEPSALCRAVHRWAHDERSGRRVAAAAYGQAAAPHVRTPADRDLLRRAAQALLARPTDTTLHGGALAVLLRDPQVRARYLPDALACFRDPECGARLPAEALVAALPVLPDPDAVFAALRARADGEVLRALAALTTPALARRAGDLVREHLARCPSDAPHAAAFLDRRLEQGPAAEPVLRPLVLELLRSAPTAVRAALAAVLAAPGGEPSYPLRGELADVLLREEADPAVLDAFLGAVAAGAAERPRQRTRDLLRRTGRQLLRLPGGPALFEQRTVELSRADPAFGAVTARWLGEATAEAAALLGPGARRTVETLGRGAPDIT
ncbi:serine protease [Streptomyces sp. NPDC051578]|uniref:serine protease n=1 Tax=Streptomyces sp. NPDC051578 TaxID=3365662 RepID=UPI0037AD9152